MKLKSRDAEQLLQIQKKKKNNQQSFECLNWIYIYKYIRIISVIFGFECKFDENNHKTYCINIKSEQNKQTKNYSMI